MASPNSLIVAPSLLAADFARIGDEVRAAAVAGADWIHLDVMDGHFVPNISFGPAVAGAALRDGLLPGDAHLMIERPDVYLEAFLRTPARNITVHVEAAHDVAATLRAIRSAGRTAGLALNPETPLEKAAPFLEQTDLLLVMTVHPGFGGQKFIPEMIGKIEAAARLRETLGLRFRIEVDGGIDAVTGARCVAAGADTLVAGTSVFGREDYAAAIAALRGGAGAGGGG